MRTIRRSCAATLLVALALSARAEDPAPKKHDLRAAQMWETGEVVTETAVDESSIDVTAQGGRAPANETKHHSRNEWTFVRRCDEVSAAGSPAKSLVFVAKWVNDRDGDVDKSIDGALVETSTQGWTLLTPATRPSPAARRWLDDRCGPGPDRNDLADQAPEAPVAVGESWTPRAGSPLDDVARGRHFAVQFPPGEDRATLASVDPSPDGDVVHVTFEAHGALVGELKKWNGGTLTVDEGSYQSNVSADGVPGRWRRGGRASFKGEMNLKTTTPDGVVKVAASFDYEHASVVGGGLPAPPARVAAAGPRFRFAHETNWKAGDTVTETARTDVVMTETPVGADGKAGATSTKAVATSWSIVRRCVEATPEGAPTRFLVWIKDWKSDEGGTSDACLAATLVEVSARGASIQNPDVRPTPTARTWLDRTFGSLSAVAADDAIRALVTPLAPMGVGDKWSPDPLVATAFFRAWCGFPLDPKGATTSAGVETAQGEGAAVQATVAYEIHVPIACVEGPDCTVEELKKGGAIDVSGKADGSPATWTQAGAVSDETKLAVSVRDQGGGIRRLAMTQTRKRTRTPGGDIPDKK